MSAESALAVRGLNVAYGESRVLFDVDLEVAPRQIVACVGRNGAGKTTLLRTVAGFLKPSSGAVTSGGASLAGRPPYEVARLGIKYVPQDKKVFSDLTVAENLELASYATGDHDWDRVTAYFPKLGTLMDRKAAWLSGGERLMLMIGRALLGRPGVLLVDEPTEGLAPSVVTQLQEVFRDVGRGAALVIVEQNLPLVCALADRLYALKEGRVALELRERGAIHVDAFEEYL